MKPTTCHAVIAGGNTLFRSHLKSILKMAEEESHEFSITTQDAFSMDELEMHLNNHTDVVFMDSGLVIKEGKRLSRTWKKLNPECSFAVLLSDSNAESLKQVIQELAKQNALPPDIHILKNNYPDELIMRVIMRMIEFECMQKNLAVV
jgi:DNA-binding NarL/FixJ family response regulator